MCGVEAGLVGGVGGGSSGARARASFSSGIFGGRDGAALGPSPASVRAVKGPIAGICSVVELHGRGHQPEGNLLLGETGIPIGIKATVSTASDIVGREESSCRRECPGLDGTVGGSRSHSTIASKISMRICTPISAVLANDKAAAGATMGCRLPELSAIAALISLSAFAIV